MRDLLKDGAVVNTDRELFREQLGDRLDPNNYYSPSVHVTQSGTIGINVGGYVIVMSIRSWHEAAQQSVQLTAFGVGGLARLGKFLIRLGWWLASHGGN